MTTRTAIARIATGAILGAALVVGTAPAAFAAPGDWTNLSQTTSATTYPEVGNIAEPIAGVVRRSPPGALAAAPVVGQPTGVLHRRSSTRQRARDHARRREVFPAWDTVTKNPTLISLGGQRFLSFSGLNDGPHRGAVLRHLRRRALVGGVQRVDVRDAERLRGLRLRCRRQRRHPRVGRQRRQHDRHPLARRARPMRTLRRPVRTRASACPAAAPTTPRQPVTRRRARSTPPSTATATPRPRTASRSGQILPASCRLAAGTRTRPRSGDGKADSSDPSQKVAMVGRPGGGVYVAYVVGYPTARFIRVLNVVTGATLDVPGSANADAVAMSAEPDGRLWLTWEQGDKVKAVHTNARRDAVSGRSARGARPAGRSTSGSRPSPALPAGPRSCTPRPPRTRSTCGTRT